MDYDFTGYFENTILKKRTYLKKEWCIRVVENPLRTGIQDNGRVRLRGYIDELGRYLRVVTLADRRTIHNAFPDRRFQP